MQKEIQQNYVQWTTSPAFDEATRAELRAIADDENELFERFRCNLDFGTGGLRGIMGAGTNRMNRYTVGKATLGLANRLSHSGKDNCKVAIAFDTRLHSAEFAGVSADVLSAKGIEVYLFDRPVPTPVLSFAVRYLRCDAGIVLTASHNPKIYNGYKVYDETGCQLNIEDAEDLISYVNAIVDWESIPREGDPKKIHTVGSKVLDAFVEAVLKQSRIRDAAVKANLRIVYTPLHGSGLLPVTAALEADGFTNVTVVREQAVQDGNFPTVKSPNPEEHAALNMGLTLAKAIGADIVLGTDPDSDRVGIGVRCRDGEYRLLTGNQVGAMLVDFVLANTDLSVCGCKTPTIVKTVVTGELGADAARAHGADVVDVLTGFKFIGDRMNRYEAGKENRAYIMGYEESYGYLIGEHARDKDAVVSVMLICEMAAACKAEGKTLEDRLEELYKEHGFYLDTLDSKTYEGAAGMEKIASLMHDLRIHAQTELPEKANLVDFEQGVADLPRSNVLKFVFADGSWAAVRPSGTEPKIKFYYSVKAESRAAAQERLERIRSVMERNT
ncbi:MAG: phospho-sugar mutase [Clostridia bacterium]|nr:phospho-sugar mutase [Clostridia bacterium]